MQLQLLTFSSDINASLQVGDIVYYSPTGTAPNSGFDTIISPNTIVTFGVVTAIWNEGSTIPFIAPHSIIVIYDDINPVPTGVIPPTSNEYIMFSKNKEVNSSSLIGYYADIEFRNYSTDKVELFSIGSEVSENSK